MRQGRLAGSLAVVTAAACFGTLGPVSRLAYNLGMTPLGFVAWRSGIGALLVAGFVARRIAGGEPVADLAGLTSRSQRNLVVASLSGLVLNLAIFAAFARTSVALVLLGFYTYPAMVTVLGVVIRTEHLDRARAVALTLALAGMSLVVLAQLDPSSGLRLDVVGLLLALLAAASQTVYIHVSRHGSIQVPSDQMALIVLTVAATSYLVVATATGSLANVTFPVTRSATWPILALAGVVGAGIPTFLFLGGIRRIGGVRTSILAMFEPVVGVTLAAVVLGEAIRPVQIAGGALILVAGVLLQRAPEPFRRDGPLGPSGPAGSAPPTARADLEDPDAVPTALV